MKKKKVDVRDWIILLLVLRQIVDMFPLETPLTPLNYAQIIIVAILAVTTVINIYLAKAGS